MVNQALRMKIAHWQRRRGRKKTGIGRYPMSLTNRQRGPTRQRFSTELAKNENQMSTRYIFHTEHNITFRISSIGQITRNSSPYLAIFWLRSKSHLVPSGIAGYPVHLPKDLLKALAHLVRTLFASVVPLKVLVMWK